jgi:hypothetical protein
LEKEISSFKTKVRVKSLHVLYAITVLISSCTYKKAELNLCDGVKYSVNIVPLVQTHCALAGCHNGDSMSVGDFNNYTDIKMRVDNGQFKIKVIDTQSMPPPSRPSLTSNEFNLLKCWFEAGAPEN